MMKYWLFVIGLAFASVALSSQQDRPTIVVNVFTTSPGVTLPYDMKQMQGQLVAEFKTMIGKDYDIVSDAPATPQGTVYTLDAEITAWHPGNAAKRILVGLGSGRETTDVQYRLTDRSGKKVVEHKDTIRTNFYSQAAGSTGTLGHPIAQKITERIKEANMK